MTIRSKKEDTNDYALDVLKQLARLAKSEGLDRLADRIETVIAAEQADSRSPPAGLSSFCAPATSTGT